MLLGMLDAGARGNASSAPTEGLGVDALAAARRIGAYARVGLLPMHDGVQVMLVARQLAQAFEALGDSVAILDPAAPWLGAGASPPIVERALHDASARARRVLVVFGAPHLQGSAEWLLSALDGVLLIARPGGSTEFRLHKLLRQIDPDMDMGTLRGFPCPPAMVRAEQSSAAPHADA